MTKGKGVLIWGLQINFGEQANLQMRNSQIMISTLQTYMISFTELAHRIVEAGRSEIQEADWQVETQAGAEAAIWAVFLLPQGKLNFTL